MTGGNHYFYMTSSLEFMIEIKVSVYKHHLNTLYYTDVEDLDEKYLKLKPKSQRTF